SFVDDSDSWASYDSRLTMSYNSISTKGFRRGIVIFIDTFADSALAEVIEDTDDGAYVLQLMGRLVDRLVSTFGDNDYVSIVSSDGVYDGHPLIVDDSMSDYKGLGNTHKETLNAIRDNLDSYFSDTVSVEVVPNNLINDKREEKLLLSMLLLNNSVDTSVSLETILEERLANNFGFSATQAALSDSTHPLPNGSPLYLFHVSLGAFTASHTTLLNNLLYGKSEYDGKKFQGIGIGITPFLFRLNTETLLSSSSTTRVHSMSEENARESLCVNEGFYTSIDVLYYIDNIAMDASTLPSESISSLFISNDAVEQVHEAVFEAQGFCINHAHSMMRYYVSRFMDVPESDLTAESIVDSTPVTMRMHWDPILEEQVFEFGIAAFSSFAGIESVVSVYVSGNWVNDQIFDWDSSNFNTDMSYSFLLSKDGSILF
ncbi:hypothetical protein ADUPG1_000982, partial [Aduncisulcus paluster]